MLLSRIIPCLLLQQNGLVKTTKFKNSKYVGDPINAVKIFNEKKVDELIILDIDSTQKNKEPNYKLIKSIAEESRMPLSYGGGIKNADQAKKIFSLGLEKIIINSEFFNNYKIVDDIANLSGSQSISVCVDIKKNIFSKYNIYIDRGKKKVKMSLNNFFDIINNLQIGEIVINSIDNDGVMNGYDLNLFNTFRTQTSLPITMLGGAGHVNDLKKLIKASGGVVGAAAGSLFVFKGKYRAVLINYPSEKIKNEILYI